MTHPDESLPMIFPIVGNDKNWQLVVNKAGAWKLIEALRECLKAQSMVPEAESARYEMARYQTPTQQPQRNNCPEVVLITRDKCGF